MGEDQVAGGGGVKAVNFLGDAPLWEFVLVWVDIDGLLVLLTFNVVEV